MRRPRPILAWTALIIPFTVFALFLLADIARCDAVSVEFRGRVATVDDPFDLLEGAVRPKDSVQGTYGYLSAIEDADPSEESGAYWSADFPAGIRLRLGSLVVESDPVDVGLVIEVTDAEAGDTWELTSYNNRPHASGHLIERIVWSLEDPTGNALHDDRLPLRAPDLRMWNSAEGLRVYGCVPQDYGGCDYLRMFIVTVEIESAELDTSELACRQGAVNAALSSPCDVLHVNGQAGDDARREVRIDCGSPIEIVMSAPPTVPSGPSPFCLYVWTAEPAGTTVRRLPLDLGTLCMPSPITGANGHPLHRVANNLGREGFLGEADLVSYPAPSVVISIPSGIGRPLDAFVQGVIADPGSRNGVASVTNGVLVRVR